MSAGKVRWNPGVLLYSSSTKCAAGAVGVPGKSVYALEIQLFPELERQDRAGNPGRRLRARGDSAISD